MTARTGNPGKGQQWEMASQQVLGLHDEKHHPRPHEDPEHARAQILMYSDRTSQINNFGLQTEDI